MSKLFSFKGRLSRWNYCIGTVLVYICLILFLLLPWLLIYVNANMMDFMGWSMLVGILGCITATVCLFSLTVRRLHDAGLSGLISLLLLTGVGQILCLILWFYPATEGENQYGPDPLAE